MINFEELLMRKNIYAGFIGLILFNASALFAQDSSKLFLTTAVGIINGIGNFGKAVSPSVAFNSGVEYKISNRWYAQAQLDFNTLQYSQQIRSTASQYLFKQTSSSLLQLGLQAGYNLPLGKKFFISPYVGTGYLNVGEPRIEIDNINLLAIQSVERQSGVFGRTGIRLAYRTKSKLLQTVYVDGSYWYAPIDVQNGKVQGTSIYVGTRFGI